MIYICLYNSHAAGEGITLQDAHQDLCDNNGDLDINDCTFYEATPIDVEVLIIKKEIPVKQPKKG